MAENPEGIARLADAIAKRLDDKFGWQQGWMRSEFEELKQGQKDLADKLDTVSDNVGTLTSNVQTFAEKQNLFQRRTKRRLEDIKRRTA